MFISNIPDKANGGLTASGGLAAPNRKELLPHHPKDTYGSFKRDVAYRFECLNHLLAVCCRLCSIGFSCESTAWQDDRERYFLFISLRTGTPYSMPEALDFVVEYGSIENADALRTYIREHGRLICQSNAISKLGSLS